MSGVYIPNWEKPKSCDKCWAEYAYEICNSHSGACPLIAVPDHGRLIDADAEVGVNLIMMPGGKCQVAFIAPTVIPADKEAETCPK